MTRCSRLLLLLLSSCATEQPRSADMEFFPGTVW